MIAAYTILYVLHNITASTIQSSIIAASQMSVQILLHSNCIPTQALRDDQELQLRHAIYTTVAIWKLHTIIQVINEHQRA